MDILCLLHNCFHRLLVEDYLMLLALAMHNVEAVLAQIYAKYVFDLEAVLNGDLSRITTNFTPNSQKAFVALGICINLSMIGILIVKINFSLFLRRIGANIGGRFNVMWWAVVLFTLPVQECN